MVRPKLESDFVKDVLKPALRDRFPGCYIIKQDSSQLQGIPDLLVLYNDHWALLETKRGLRSAKQPNQEYYVDTFHNLSFAAFVNPDNVYEVLDDLQKAFGA